ncbi:PREDICTED: uncharacterized protein LOC107189225 isoform X2 [Dufourea novaeangliae]|uniref:Uncharacterized protein n=1 Tax=Dufourea novaeangliae TaxID=178035 RepID=A0A154PGU5_DUFNO|nr:PREDICTED: uncharacterized protein LOC107189225 isoform X2 [Dufourea novaeangliae]KZC11081.1 hypothetical protein WN55_02442 [Dufourea novaeangliae]
MGPGIGIATIVAAILCSHLDGQGIQGADWLGDLTKSISELNRNIQENVQQLNREVQERVQSNVEHAHRLTSNLDKKLVPGTAQTTGNNVVVSDGHGTRIVQSGRTSNGRTFVRESSDDIVDDTLRHVDKIYDPEANTTRVYGYTLNLKDPNAKPVLIDSPAT